MKRVIYAIFALLVLVAFTGCNKDKTPSGGNALNIVGEWHCTAEAFDAEVYVSFNDAGTFDLYQRVGEGRYRHFTGTWWIKGTTLSGSYTDGTAWGDDYAVTLAGDTMTLTPTKSDDELMTYTRETIPAEVKDESVEARSMDIDTRPIF